jgi:hypothetical protein
MLEHRAHVCKQLIRGAGELLVVEIITAEETTFKKVSSLIIEEATAVMIFRYYDSGLPSAVVPGSYKNTNRTHTMHSSHY